jgi:hypothetical protein
VTALQFRRISVNILFDSMGVQVQVQNETGDRLTTWTSSLTGLGYTLTYSDYTQPLSTQLDGIDVLVSLTRQWYQTTGTTDPISSGICFGYSSFGFAAHELGHIQSWVQNGGGVLLFTNHGYPIGDGPFWPVNDIQLAGALGITLTFAEFATPTGATLTMTPGPDAPPALVQGVSHVEAWDSSGIMPSNGSSTPGSGTVILPLPPSDQCGDSSGFGFSPEDFAFAVLYTFGSGNVIVLGHSGIAGNNGTINPSPGQIESADNMTFLNNCIAFLGG